MGKKSGSDNGAAAARADEQARQERIRAGTERINRIFDGGPAIAPGAPQVPQLGIGGMFGDAAQKLVDGMIPGSPGVDATPGAFGEDFYKGREKAYTDYALPQLDKQFGEARKKLTFDLARSGTLNSSSRASKDAELQSTYDTGKRGVFDEALTQSNNARNAVEGARSDLMAMLNSTGDAEGVANSAIHRATALSQPAAFSPLAQMFANTASAIGTQAAAERAQAYSGGAYKAPFNTGLFAPSSNAVKVT